MSDATGGLPVAEKASPVPLPAGEDCLAPESSDTFQYETASQQGTGEATFLLDSPVPVYWIWAGSPKAEFLGFRFQRAEVPRKSLLPAGTIDEDAVVKEQRRLIREQLDRTSETDR